MTTIGTLEMYQSLANILNEDDMWKELAAGIDYSVIWEYLEPVNKAFFMGFESGTVSDVREVSDVELEAADYVLTASPEVWKRVYSKVPKARASGFHLALSTNQIRTKGAFMAAYLKSSKAWEHMLDQISLNKLAGVNPS